MTDAPSLRRLVRRADFVACSKKGRRVPTAAFVLQERPRGDDAPPRFGFTVTKKTGGAVERNRMRRRLKEAVRLSAAGRARSGSDYVLIASRAALTRPFETLQVDLEEALQRAGRQRPRDVPRSPAPETPTASGRTDG
ncbi:ribonuclease P protein component [Phreatobacter sp.]|uniref:ribonuclease P protein component n=1 Tax=Phreatobacter sp. TaxID=1966341 RepID=UPI003F70941D